MGGFKEKNRFRVYVFLIHHVTLVWNCLTKKWGSFYWICAEEMNSSLLKIKLRWRCLFSPMFSNYLPNVRKHLNLPKYLFLTYIKNYILFLVILRKKYGSIFPLTLRFKVSVACIILSLPSLHIDFHFLLTLNPRISMLKSRTSSYHKDVEMAILVLFNHYCLKNPTP